MGQLITRSTGGIEKKDTNTDYQTYGDGDAYAIDANGEYQPSDYDEVEERDDVKGTRRFTPAKQQQQAKRCSCVCLAISCLALVAVGLLAGGLAAYFLHLAPASSAQNVTNQGQVVVGGYDGSNYLSSVELFPPSDSCSIPDLPQAGNGHSLSLLSGGRLVVCGGNSCISWVAGSTSWTHLPTMSMWRGYHTAWTPPSLPDSIVLLGGDGSAAKLTAEILPGGATFALSHGGGQACGIPDGETLILTGGRTHSFVTRYDVNGFVKELPQLPESRFAHACAALPTTGALVVAGGRDRVDGSNYLSSVLTLLPGAKAWTPLASLPRALGFAHASIVGGKMRVTGGRDGSSRSRSEVLEYQPGAPDKWSVVGNLRVARVAHAVLSIGPNQLPCL